MTLEIVVCEKKRGTTVGSSIGHSSELAPSEDSSCVSVNFGLCLHIRQHPKQLLC